MLLGWFPPFLCPTCFVWTNYKNLPDLGVSPVAVPGHVEASKVLLSHGAQLDSQDEFLMTPLATAVKEGQELTWHRSCPVFLRDKSYGLPISKPWFTNTLQN
jgi:hypothetical protein